MSDDTPWHGARSWTAAEATAALPLVRRIVDDLVQAYRRWREAVEAFEYATSGTRADLPSTEADELMLVAQKLAAEIDGYRDELGKLEIRVLRVDRGLVAFRSEREGGVTSLFWTPGAPAPTYTLPEPGSGEEGPNGTSISWPSLAQVVAGKRSRA